MMEEKKTSTAYLAAARTKRQKIDNSFVRIGDLLRVHSIRSILHRQRLAIHVQTRLNGIYFSLV